MTEETRDKAHTAGDVAALRQLNIGIPKSEVQETNVVAEPRLILHIGGAKCGSSALQTELSVTDWAAQNSEFVYATLDPVNGIFQGDAMRLHAMEAQHGYAASASAHDLLGIEPNQRRAMFDELRTLAAVSKCVVLSNEGWLQQADAFVDGGLLDEIGLPFDIFLVVRPQVEFLNSGWWQWGAWEDAPLVDWVRRAAQEVHWHRFLEKWIAHPNCREVKVRLMSKDIVGDFFAAFSLSRLIGGEGNKLNASLPGDILRLYQRHRHLRPGPQFPATDFVIGRLGISGAPTPWVIPPDLAAEVIAASRADNERLLAMLPEDDAARMLADPAWWSTEAFADKTLQSPLPQEPDAAAIDGLCASIVEAVARFDLELRLLRSQVAATAAHR